MQLYNIPKNIRTFIFDIDGTLYNSQEYVLEQIDVQIRHWSELNGWSAKEGREKIASYRKEFERTHNGKKISLGNTFLHFGVDIDTSIQWRNTLLHPEDFLTQDKELRKALLELKKDYNLVCVTNNPVYAARKTLEVVGIDDVIPDIIGLDTLKKSKPAREIIDYACTLTQSHYNECVSVGDRYDIDLSMCVELGMGGILVDGARDVCKISEAICQAHCS